MADMMKKVPVREQDAKERACNFEEVCLGYNADEAVAEAQRCLNCKMHTAYRDVRFRSISPASWKR